MVCHKCRIWGPRLDLDGLLRHFLFLSIFFLRHQKNIFVSRRRFLSVCETFPPFHCYTFKMAGKGENDFKFKLQGGPSPLPVLKSSILILKSSILVFKISILLFKTSILLFKISILVFKTSILLFQNQYALLFFKTSILLFKTGRGLGPT